MVVGDRDVQSERIKRYDRETNQAAPRCYRSRLFGVCWTSFRENQHYNNGCVLVKPLDLRLCCDFYGNCQSVRSHGNRNIQERQYYAWNQLSQRREGHLQHFDAGCGIEFDNGGLRWQLKL